MNVALMKPNCIWGFIIIFLILNYVYFPNLSICCGIADHVINNWFLILKDYLKSGFEKKLVRIVLGNKRRIVKILNLEVYNLCG